MILLLDDKTAIVDPEMFSSLLDYSSSLPTGTTIGKRWKRRRDYHDESKGWVMGEYLADSDPDYVQIKWRDLEVVT